MRILWLVSLVLITAPPQQTPRSAASVKGVVVQTGSLEPVAKAIVRLAGGPGVEPLVLSTGADGRFEFQNVAAGTYDLVAGRSGFLSTSFGQRGPSGTGSKLAVEAGSNIDNIRLLMTATGVISGRVLDNTGEPLANVTVQALKFSYEDGQRKLSEVKADSTDDLGQFRLFWLPPGQYFVSAQPAGGGVYSIVRDSSRRTIAIDSHGMLVDPLLSPAALKPGEALVPVYYPGTADPQSASRVEVPPGADIRGIDLVLARVTTRTVRGAIFDGDTGRPVEVANVMLAPRGNGSTIKGSFSDGKFEIFGVLPGIYRLVANARLGPNTDVRNLIGQTRVEIADADLDNINITLHRGFDVAGSVTWDGHPEGLPADAHPVIFLQSRQDTILPSQQQFFADFRDNKEFSFQSVLEGDYRLWWDNLPAGMYIKSAMFGPLDALNIGIQTDRRAPDRLQIVIGSNSGSLEGVVRDNLRNVVPRARVALVPDPTHRQRADLYKSTLTDESGRFRLQGIPPGDYSLFAWEDIEKDLWQDAEFIGRHESAGKPIHVIENGRETVETVAIPFAF